MRASILLLALALAAPVASAAASQVHVTWLGDEYAVTYVDNLTGAPATMRVRADAGGYQLEGRDYALPRPPDADATARIAFVADLGTDRNAAAIVRAIVNESPSLVLVGGDLSYAHGDLEVWDRFFRVIEPLASQVAFMPAFGNHEMYCDKEGGGYEACDEEVEFFDARFELPNGDRFYYAFDWGPARISVLDTEAYVEDDHVTNAAEQNAFLNASLAADKERWDIVAFHRALNTTNTHEGAQVGDQREHLEPILDGGADLVLQAHVHAYERAKETENGTLFVTSGGGGRPVYEEWLPEPGWLAKRAAEHHFVMLEVSPTRIEGRALRPDGSVLDSFSLEKPAPPSRTPVTTTTTAPTPPPVHRDGPNNSTNATPEVTESGTPLGWVLALLAITLSARLLRRPSR